jgi:hypothetical protein
MLSAALASSPLLPADSPRRRPGEPAACVHLPTGQVM